MTRTQATENKKLPMDRWLRGLCYQIYEIATQKILSRHLKNPIPLPCLEGVTCIVTGSTSGIGLEIARQLAVAGADVVMAVRNVGAATDLIMKWRREWVATRPLKVSVMEIDLLCLGSVARFAESWNSSSRPLNILINNAGVCRMGMSQEFSVDGYETHLQVNHLAPAFLSLLLLPSLITGSPSRIVNVSSSMHYLGLVDPNDMNATTTKYSSMKGYADSKLAHVMFSGMLQMRLPAGVGVACVSPGVVHTNVHRDLPEIVRWSSRYVGPLYMFAPGEGARSALFAATDGEFGEYCEGLRSGESGVCAFVSAVCRPIRPADEACDLEKAGRVWVKTLGMVGLSGGDVERLLNGEVVESNLSNT